MINTGLIIRVKIQIKIHYRQVIKRLNYKKEIEKGHIIENISIIELVDLSRDT
jgi:hypothetical protein